MLSMARRRAQLSQRELARRARVPQATISRIENRVVSPTLDTLTRLIGACGMQLRPIDRRGSWIDRSQLRERLRMTPAERLQLAANAANGVRLMRQAFSLDEAT